MAADGEELEFHAHMVIDAHADVQRERRLAVRRRLHHDPPSLSGQHLHREQAQYVLDQLTGGYRMPDKPKNAVKAAARRSMVLA